MQLENDLWTYAVNVYSKSSVKEICLELQDNYNLDVNLLLTCGWLALKGYKIELSSLMSTHWGWQQEVLKPLRQIRKSLDKSDSMQNRFREKLLKLELVAEQMEIATIYKEYEKIYKEYEEIGRDKILQNGHNKVAICYQNLLDYISASDHANHIDCIALKSLASVLTEEY